MLFQNVPFFDFLSETEFRVITEKGNRVLVRVAIEINSIFTKGCHIISIMLVKELRHYTVQRTSQVINLPLLVTQAFLVLPTVACSICNMTTMSRVTVKKPIY